MKSNRSTFFYMKFSLNALFILESFHIMRSACCESKLDSHGSVYRRGEGGPQFNLGST